MKEAYKIYREITRLGGHIYIRNEILTAGPSKIISEDLRTSLTTYKENIRVLASVLNVNLEFNLEEMIEDVFTNDEARFCGESLPPEGLLTLEEIERRIKDAKNPIS